MKGLTVLLGRPHQDLVDVDVLRLPYGVGDASGDVIGFKALADASVSGFDRLLDFFTVMRHQLSDYGSRFDQRRAHSRLILHQLMA